MSQATTGSAGQLVHGDDNLRLMAKVARMYHERGMKQAEIAAQLLLSQARVSRLLKRAAELGVVRTIVALPPGVHTDVEEALQEAYGLHDAIVVDAGEPDEDPTAALGAAAGQYLEATLAAGEVVGVSSWSATLLATVESMRPARVQAIDSVVQLVGGMGEPRVQLQASRLLGLLASCTGGQPVSLPAPGLLGAPSARDSLMADPTVARVMDRWPAVTTALVGIGSLDQSPLLRESGNALTDADRRALEQAGAVGDICLRFYDADGRPVGTAVDDRVIGIRLEELGSVPRRIAVAGGADKHAAIAGALRGGWLTVLVTDLAGAQRLLEAADAP